MTNGVLALASYRLIKLAERLSAVRPDDRVAIEAVAEDLDKLQGSLLLLAADLQTDQDNRDLYRSKNDPTACIR